MMKQILFIFCFLFFSIGALSQSFETFDIATFQPPTGWKKQNKDGLVIFSTSNQQKGTYVMIMLYASGKSSGDAAKDFDADWQEFIAGQLAIKGKPATEPLGNADGWEIVTGGTSFENEQSKRFVGVTPGGLFQYGHSN